MDKRVELPSTTETWSRTDTQGQNKIKTLGQQKLYQVCAHVLALRTHSSPVRQMFHIFMLTNETNRLSWSKWLANTHIISNGECRGSHIHRWEESTVSPPSSCLQDKGKWLPLKTWIPRKTSTDSTTLRPLLLPRSQDHRKEKGIITALDPLDVFTNKIKIHA